MSWFDKIRGTSKPSGSCEKEFALLIDGPDFGPVGKEKLIAIVEHVRSRLNDRYGHVLVKIEPFVSLDVGSISLVLNTIPISAELANEISDFGMRYLRELAANPSLPR